jgi:hypothetical protein
MSGGGVRRSRHAGVTRHTSYELATFQFCNATITDPAVGEAGSPK